MDQKIQLLSEGFIARHETFCPRYGWLKKGYDGVRSDGGIFDAPDAIERLGVGKNMVRSIQFWCATFKMIEPADTEKRRLSGEMRATRLTDDLLADDGWDPYLEDPASLWLLHWLLFTPPIIAPSWSMAISVSGMQRFTVKDLMGVLLDYQPMVPAFARLSPSSFEKDASCFARMYGGSGQGASEEIECPFADLGLLTPAEKRGGFRYRIGDKTTLPDLIFLAACCDYAHHFHSSARAVSSRWIEIQNMIDRAVGLLEADQNLLKIIDLLNLVAGPHGIWASAGVAAYAMDGPGAAAGETAESLARLSRKGLLLYREYADEYRLWEGTDVDIRGEIAKEREQLGRQPIEDLLENAFPLGPVIAARHSYETGTLRRFERRWAGPEAFAGEKPLAIPGAADGLILYGFVKSGDAQTLPPAHAEDGRPVLTATADREEQVRDLALEAAASRSILTASPELARDGVARKEARFRARAAESRLRQYLEDLFTPGSRDGVWRCGQTVYPLQSNRNLSELLSHLCDAAFPKAPVLRNELIKRNGLTGAAARARRELIGAMIDGEGEEHLGMSGTGPEVAIYRTMLLAEGLH